ncbi:hypothetical protein BD779DRAFT_1489617 [Infundibulicybe gibba]|nr:hypothetical protein BD779DRAFT_1489617 [Infundibulicybe gibba]
MKFGKRIQAQQVPGWSQYYLDYKFLKKIISSLLANRPASEAATLALGIRPSDFLSHSPPSFPQPESRSPATVLDGGPGDHRYSHRSQGSIFLQLERELEKINGFYLRKEAELKLRMETLLSKRRAAAMRGLPATLWSAVEEGFRLLERDLGKLQQFVEINGIGFRKILKKFDKRSTSTTKELYLARQVDVQPVFNRQLISELSDTVATCLLDLTDLSSGLKFEGPGANDIFAQQLMADRTPIGPFRDLENNLRAAIAGTDATAVQECVHYSDLLAQQDGGRLNVTRILWNAIIEAPPDIAELVLASLSSPFDFQFVDDINGRTCLHESAIAGILRLVDLCIIKGVQVSKSDVYGRTALHYASMNGHSAVCKRLLEAGILPNIYDMDNYSALVYATMKGSVDCVEVLLKQGNVSPEPHTPNGDLIPLSLASQFGHVDVVSLLLQHGAKCIPNSNGEYPMHLAAREGHVEACKLLLRLDGWDTPDKYHEWTPLFHAARYGREHCVHILLAAGSHVNATDELGHRAVHYAAWHGHQACISALLEYASSTSSLPTVANIPVDSPASSNGVPPESDIDHIPSLSLPPPIMPHRVYGHNYLDKNHFIQISIGHGSTGVSIHHRLISPAFRDEYIIASTPLKLVMTTSPTVNSAPYSISLPQRDKKAVFTFQVASLENLSLEFSIYPNFGTKTIGRAVALPSLFSDIENQIYALPILDHRLQVVGEVEFEVNVITPFDGVRLEVGGDVETYWKSMGTPLSSSQPPNPRSLHRSSLISSAQASPSNQSATSSIAQSLTISSLRGNYIYVVVQVTRDLHPVVFSDWLLPESNFELTVPDITLAQFESLAERSGRGLNFNPGFVAKDWIAHLSRAMVPLERLLKALPSMIGVSLELAYPSRTIRENFATGHRLNLNVFADSVLRTIYHTAVPHDLPLDRRRIVFTSFSPDISALLNWKQPNYENDERISSVGAAVEFAKTNNLLGIFINADLLVGVLFTLDTQVPSLIDGIRSAGLLVGFHGSPENPTPQFTPSGLDASSADAFLGDGMVTFVDHSLRELF